MRLNFYTMADIPSRKSTIIAERFTVEGNTFKRAVTDNPRDKIEIEIGDSKQPDFKPQAKISRWSNEVNFSLRAEEHPEAVVRTEGKLIKYITPDYEVHQYELDPGEIGEDGGLEFEWVLPQKPAFNVLTATIQAKELDFFYQPALTQKEIDEGASRPENVVGSYAVYHKTKGGMNRADGMEYKTGKAFHIYRPKVTDKKGEEAWAELNIDEQAGVLSVTVPQEFLDKAVYPVIVDPTFGYTSSGASNRELYNSSDGTFYGRATRFTLPESGDITDLSGYFAVSSGKIGGAKLILYTNGSGVPSTKIVSTSEDTYTSATSELCTGTVTTSQTTGDLWLAATGRVTNESGGGQSASVKYDSGGDDSSYDNSYNYTTPDATWTESTGGTDKYSIYATYTPTTDSYPSVVGSITTGTSSAVSHTVSSGTDVLVVSIGTHQGAISNVQWSGNALTLAVDADTAYNENAEIWYLNSPTAGTGNITYTSNGSHTGWAAINVQDCASVSSPTTAEESSSDGDLSITAPAYQCLVIDAIYSEANVTKDTADATQAADIQGNSYENFGSMHVPVGPGQVKIMGWNLASGQRTAHVALALQAISIITSSTAADVVTGTLSLPAPTVTAESGATNVSVDADVVILTGSLPAPTVTGKANVAADVVTTTLSVQAATITGKANVTADVVTKTLSVQAPTVTGIQNVSTAADVVTTTLSLPAPTITGIQNVSTTADVVTATGSLPSPTITAAQNVSTTADLVMLTGTLPEPTISTDNVVNVSADADLLTATLSVQAPTVTAIQNATTSADVVTTTLSIPEPTITTTRFVSVVPDAVVLASSLPEPTVTTIRNVSTTADVVTAIGSLPSPTITGSSLTAADLLSLAAALPTPTITAIRNSSVTADVVTTMLSVPDPTLAVEGGYSGNASWGIDINTFGLVMNKKARIPTWTTTSRPTGRKGLFGWNRLENRIEIYDQDSDSWYYVSGTEV